MPVGITVPHTTSEVHVLLCSPGLLHLCPQSSMSNSVSFAKIMLEVDSFQILQFLDSFQKASLSCLIVNCIMTWVILPLLASPYGVNHGINRRGPLWLNLAQDLHDGVLDAFIIFFFQATNFKISAPLVPLQLRHSFSSFSLTGAGMSFLTD